MHYRKLHKKVFLWWNSFIAVQLVNQFEFSFGVRVEPRRPLIDVFLGPFTVAVGYHPVLTDPRMNQFHSGRGFVNSDQQLRDLGDVCDARIL